MSMIGSLIDELNKSADEWNESNMFELACMCRNAAYTILELQNDADLLRAMLSQVQTEKRCHMAENDKLRDERREYQATIDSLVDECADHKAENDRLWDYIAHKRYLQDFARLVDENSKLRKLVRDMWEGYNDPRCEECHLKDTPTCADCPICAREASVIDRMRELGVDE